MNVHNFKLGNVFRNNAREYTTRPVIAAKYQKGMENGFCVFYSNVATKKTESTMYEGIRFFQKETDAWEFIKANERQYIKGNDGIIGMEVTYNKPQPVLYRKDADAENLDGIQCCFGEHAFMSDESKDYEFYILDSNHDGGCWIIQDVDGNIRVWDRTMEELFFGEESEYVYTRNDKGEYVHVTV